MYSSSRCVFIDRVTVDVVPKAVLPRDSSPELSAAWELVRIIPVLDIKACDVTVVWSKAMMACIGVLAADTMKRNVPLLAAVALFRQRGGSTLSEEAQAQRERQASLGGDGDGDEKCTFFSRRNITGFSPYEHRAAAAGNGTRSGSGGGGGAGAGGTSGSGGGGGERPSHAGCSIPFAPRSWSAVLGSLSAEEQSLGDDDTARLGGSFTDLKVCWCMQRWEGGKHCW